MLNPKMALVSLQLAGVMLSVFLVAVTYGNQKQLEQRVQAFAIAKVEQAAGEAWEERAGPLTETTFDDRLGALAQKLGVQAERVDAICAQVLPALIAYSLSDRCPKSCDFSGVVQAADVALIERAARYRVGQLTLQDFIVERYDSTVRGLITDLRRFGLVNLVVLSLMMGLVLFRNRLNWRFFALSLTVTGYTAWAAHGYVFTQNWALTILFQNWAAPGYQVAMILMSCLFADWLFFRGRVTQWIMQAFVSLLPC